MSAEWECVVVGAGVAGLSAALVLGRARRRTLVIDTGEQSNRTSTVLGGFLGHDQRSPCELYATGRQELCSYPSVEHRRAEVLNGVVVAGGVELDLEGGTRVRTRRVLLATGMQYCPPDLPGLAPLWGASVFQCPFCHGWEMRDQRLAALASGGSAIHAALLLRGWTDDVVLLTDGPPRFDSEQRRKLRSAGIAIDERRIVGLIGRAEKLASVAFADGNRLERDGLLVEAPLRQRSPLAQKLGLTTASGPASPDAVEVDPLHRTNVPSVFAAGDISTKLPHLAGAAAAGGQAAMVVVQSLLSEQFGLPFPPN
jgi:thioredoxin reductase